MAENQNIYYYSQRSFGSIEDTYWKADSGAELSEGVLRAHITITQRADILILNQASGDIGGRYLAQQISYNCNQLSHAAKSLNQTFQMAPI